MAWVSNRQKAKNAAKHPLEFHCDMHGTKFARGAKLIYGDDPRNQGFQLNRGDVHTVKGFKTICGLTYVLFEKPKGDKYNVATHTPDSYTVIND